MTIRLSVAVMAHRKREKFILTLLDALDREAEVVWDQLNDRWDTGARAMLAYPSDATHHLVVQDDALVCRDLAAGIEKALGVFSGNEPTPLGLYISKASPYLRGREGWPSSVRWLHRRGMASGVGIVMPVELIEPAIRWGSKQRHVANYDTRIGRWLEQQEITTWHPWPSLVDHRVSPSLVPQRGSRGRVAGWFLGEDKSALDVDWDGDSRECYQPPKDHRVALRRRPQALPYRSRRLPR